MNVRYTLLDIILTDIFMVCVQILTTLCVNIIRSTIYFILQQI